MNTIQHIQLLDGNIYRVDQSGNSNTVSNDFDSIFRSETGMNLDQIFQKASESYGVDERLLRAVAQAESGFDPNATSYCGAMGMMQLMPSTAESLGVTDPYDAAQSVAGGAKLLAGLLDEYNGDISLALAAYNAGGGAVAQYGGVPPYDETLGYISKINDILGGALEQDSRTIDGAKPTVLDGFHGGRTVVLGDSNGLLSQKNNMEDVKAFRADDSAEAISVTLTKDEVDSLKRIVGEPVENASLLSFEQYQTFVQTLGKIMSTLMNQVMQNQSDGALADFHQTVLSSISGESVDSSANILSNNANSNSSLNSMIDSVNSMIQSVQGQASHKTNVSPQSLYEAQASAVSPLIAKILEL